MQRRDLLKYAGGSMAMATSPLAAGAASFQSDSGPAPAVWLNVRHYGAKGDASAIDSVVINRVIEEAAASGGGTVYFPAGVFLSYSLRLKSKVGLYLDQGAVILGGPTPALPR